MSRNLLVAATAALAAACGWGFAQAQPQPSPAPAPQSATAPGDAPADPTWALIKDRCTLCHDTDLISASGRTPEAWSDLVGSMVRRGAQLSDDEKAQVVAYLVKTYPPAAGG